MGATSEAAAVRRFEFLVEGLEVERECAVGPVVIRPQGAAYRDIEAEAAATHPVVAFGSDEIRDWDSATAIAPGADVDDAEAKVRIALAILRLLQHARNRYVDAGRQLFGLRGEVQAVTRVVLAHGERLGISWRRHGNLAGWTFSSVDLDQLTDDARFSYLCDALTRPEECRGELQRRVLLALEFLDEARRSLVPRVIVLLTAIAIEILLSDDDDPHRKPRRHEITRVCKRTAYLTCRADCGRGGPDCPYLHVNDWDDVDRVDREVDGICSAFMDATSHAMLIVTRTDMDGTEISSEEHHGLFMQRNRVAHAGVEVEPDKARRLRWKADYTFLAAVDWFAVHAAARTIADLDASIPPSPASAT